jgi:hypothetical protein
MEILVTYKHERHLSAIGLFYRLPPSLCRNSANGKRNEQKNN